MVVASGRMSEGWTWARRVGTFAWARSRALRPARERRRSSCTTVRPFRHAHRTAPSDQSSMYWTADNTSRGRRHRTDGHLQEDVDRSRTRPGRRVPPRHHWRRGRKRSGAESRAARRHRSEGRPRARATGTGPCRRGSGGGQWTRAPMSPGMTGAPAVSGTDTSSGGMDGRPWPGAAMRPSGAPSHEVSVISLRSDGSRWVLVISKRAGGVGMLGFLPIVPGCCRRPSRQRPRRRPWRGRVRRPMGAPSKKSIPGSRHCVLSSGIGHRASCRNEREEPVPQQ